MSEPLLTTPWMRYDPFHERFADASDSTSELSDIWKVCRKELRQFFSTPKLPKQYDERFLLHVQLVAYATPGPDRVKVELSRDKFSMSNLRVEGIEKVLHWRLYLAGIRLLRKQKAIYVECFYNDDD